VTTRPLFSASWLARRSLRQLDSFVSLDEEAHLKGNEIPHARFSVFGQENDQATRQNLACHWTPRYETLD